MLPPESFRGLQYESKSPEKQTDSALPSLNDDAALNDYLIYAALNNPGLEASFERWTAAIKRIPQAMTLPDPRLSYGYFVRNVETRVGPQEHRFGISQMFPWIGELRVKGNVAAEEANIQWARYEEAKRKLFFDVKRNYYEYAYLQRAVDVTAENLKLLQAIETAAQARYAVGLTPYSGLSRLQVEMGKIEERLLSLQDLRRPVMARLNASLNRPAEAPLPRAGAAPEQKLEFTDEQVVQWLPEYNPELKAMSYTIRRETSAVDMARTDYFPDITLGLEWIRTGEALNPSTPDSGKDPVIATISINLPVWFGKYRSGLEEARLRQAAAKNSLRDRENSLTADLQLALYGLRDAERKIDLYRDGLIPKARQTLEAGIRDLEVGLASFLDVIDAERTLLEFELAYERAFADRAQRLAQIEMLVGEELEVLLSKEDAR